MKCYSLNEILWYRDVRQDREVWVTFRDPRFIASDQESQVLDFMEVGGLYHSILEYTYFVEMGTVLTSNIKHHMVISYTETPPVVQLTRISGDD